jgi:mannose-6-phosphate isomerase
MNQPIVLQPLYMERPWGSRRLATRLGRQIPEGRIGEAWEVVDRPEAQSVVARGPFAGSDLHTLWTAHRREVFGDVPDAPRFPILVKVLDCAEVLSVQVHPPTAVAPSLGGEPKTEMWHIMEAEPGSSIYAGLKRGVTREGFEAALRGGDVAACLHEVPTRAGDTMFIPSGRVHAIGGGNLIVEVQQNSDTTYRVFDWGRPRELHIDASMQSIDFEDPEPELARPVGSTLVDCPLFKVDRHDLTAAAEPVPAGVFAMVACIGGRITCGGMEFGKGDFFLLPAAMTDRRLVPMGEGAAVLVTTIPKG